MSQQGFAPKYAAPRAAAAAAPTGRMTLAGVSRGKQLKPFKVACYGVPGVGKTTFAAGAPNPVFLCAEDGTNHVDVARLPTPQSFADVLEAVRLLTFEKHEYKTLVIDSFDWLEPMIWAHVCAMGHKSDIEDFGYGKGYTAALYQWRLLLTALDTMSRQRGIHVVLIGHATIKRQADPNGVDFDRYRFKIHDKAADILLEWCDAVLFARYEVFTREVKGKVRGHSNGSRVLHTEWAAGFDAKNRFGLPGLLPLDWDTFEVEARRSIPAPVAELREAILSLVPRMQEPEKAQKALDEWAGQDPSRLSQLLEKMRTKLVLEQPPPLLGEQAAAPTPEQAESYEKHFGEGRTEQ